MNAEARTRNLFPSQLAVLVLASALALPALAQQPAQPQTPAVPQPTSAAAATANTDHEGFWGRVNPFARKKWVGKRLDPLKGQLNELDEVNAKNARDIQDVDGRAQAGIHQAQSTADAAGQAATAANSAAQTANSTAQQVTGHVSRIDSTISGLDQYRQVSELDVAFRGVQPVLSPTARQQLVTLASGLQAKHGYILEIEGHSPPSGPAGIQNSERMAEAVKRCLVIENNIPVYRLHSVALGNAQNAAIGKPASAGSVHVRLMENTLAAQAAASPHGDAALKVAERP